MAARSQHYVYFTASQRTTTITKRQFFSESFVFSCLKLTMLDAGAVVWAASDWHNGKASFKAAGGAGK